VSHDHAHHHHGHAHHHGSEGRLGLAFALNASFTVIELAGAYWTGSAAIAADAIHDLGDSLSLAFAWAMEKVAKKKPTAQFTYGFRRLSLVGALTNALVLLVGGALVLTETLPRLFDPPQPNSQGMMLIALLGVAVNGAAVWKTRAGHTLNERVVTWHLIEDTAGWVAVLVVSLVMQVVDLPLLDPLLAVAITLWVGWNALRNLRQVANLFLMGRPPQLSVDTLRAEVRKVPQCADLEQVHLWSLDGEHHVLSGVLVVHDQPLEEALDCVRAAHAVLEEAGVGHVTLELALQEREPAEPSGPSEEEVPGPG